MDEEGPSSVPQPTRSLKLMFIAGEDSGDQHAARVIREIRVLEPSVEVFGLGGSRMEAAGMFLEENLAQKFPIIGLSQAIRSYGRLKEVFRRAEKLMHERKPDAVVLVDYPGFNLRFSRSAREAGIPVVYYIAPQIWAWHWSRIKIIQKNVSRMLVIFPFEEKLYRDEGVSVAFCGHPLQDQNTRKLSKLEARSLAGIPGQSTVIGLIPGSREGEIVRHLPVMLHAARLIRQQIPDAEFLMPQAAGISRQLLDGFLAEATDMNIRVIGPDQPDLRSAMDFAICKSGTSTLELGLLGIPMVIIYKVSLLTWLAANIVLRIPDIGLVNIVAQKRICPERWQWAASGPRIAKNVMRYLSDPSALQKMIEELETVSTRIGGPGAAAKAAKEIVDLALTNQGRLPLS